MNSRRSWLTGICAAGAGVVLVGCARPERGSQDNRQTESEEEEESSSPGEPASGSDVSAVEDLMREHGVLRRAFLVYRESAVKLQAKADSVSPDSLQKTAKLFRDFGEEYHERKLEEAFIFPAVQKAGGPAAAFAAVLIAQHNRGREITDYILSVTAGPKLTGNLEPLLQAMEAFARMYEHHTAIEDTIVFPAWKQTLNEKQAEEMDDKFEQIEQQMFGKDGFEAAVKRIGDIETELGLADLAQFTAPAPPQLKAEIDAADPLLARSRTWLDRAVTGRV